MLNLLELGTGHRHLCGLVFKPLHQRLQPFDFLLLQLVILLLLFPVQPFSFHKGGIIAGISHRCFIFDFVYHIHHPVQKHPVMGYDDHRPVIILQIPFQPADGRHIQVVGRLVQKQDIRLA